MLSFYHGFHGRHSKSLARHTFYEDKSVQRCVSLEQISSEIKVSCKKFLINLRTKPSPCTRAVIVFPLLAPTNGDP